MWNEYLREAEKSQTLLLNEQSRHLEEGGREVFKFGFGQSPFPPLPSVVEALRSHAADKEYTSVQGLPTLRKKVASFHRQIDGIDVTAEQVLVAPGSKALLYTILAAFRRADVLIPAPAWVSYAPQAGLLGHTTLPVATGFVGRWRIAASSLKDAIKHKADPSVPSVLILNYPGNPDGLTYTDDELQELASFCREHRIMVVSDEIYGLLHHEGQHVSMARHHPQGTIVTSGLSKWCGAGGWRLGVALLPRSVPRDFTNTMLGIASETYSCAPAPVQAAACRAYEIDDELLVYLRHQRRMLREIGRWTADTLAAASVWVHAPAGGFYLFPDFTRYTDKLRRTGVQTSQALCARILADTGVALLPGSAFGLAEHHFCARLAYVEFDGQRALETSAAAGLAVPLPADRFAATFDKTIRGVGKLTDWLRSL